MLLTDDKQETNLSPQAERLLGILRDNSQSWLSRSDIAEIIDRNRLNPNDIRQLERLADLGLIDMKQEELEGFIPYQWVYKYRVN